MKVPALCGVAVCVMTVSGIDINVNRPQCEWFQMKPGYCSTNGDAVPFVHSHFKNAVQFTTV